MKTFFIESRVSKIEYVKVYAKTRKQAIKIAEKTALKWEQTHQEERQLISIS